MICWGVADIGSTAEISQGEMAGGADVAVSPPPANASEAKIPADDFCELILSQHSIHFQSIASTINRRQNCVANIKSQTSSVAKPIEQEVEKEFK